MEAAGEVGVGKAVAVAVAIPTDTIEIVFARFNATLARREGCREVGVIGVRVAVGPHIFVKWRSATCHTMCHISRMGAVIVQRGESSR